MNMEGIIIVSGGIMLAASKTLFSISVSTSRNIDAFHSLEFSPDSALFMLVGVTVGITSSGSVGKVYSPLTAVTIRSCDLVLGRRGDSAIVCGAGDVEVGIGNDSDCTGAIGVAVCVIDVGSFVTRIGDEEVISSTNALLPGLMRLSFNPLDRFVGTVGTAGFSLLLYFRTSLGRVC